MRVNVMKIFILLLIHHYKPHGYELMKRINSLSRGLIRVGPGTIYPLLFIMKSQKLIQEIRDESGRRKRYDLTDKGRKILYENLPKLREMLRDLSTIIDHVLEGVETVS